MKIKLNKSNANGTATPNVASTGINGRNGTNNISDYNSEPYKGGNQNSQLPAFEILKPAKKKNGFFRAFGLPPVWFIIVLCITAVLLPCVLILTMYESTALRFPYGECVLLEEYRTKCVTGMSGVGQQRCEEVSCCWDQETKDCYHSVPARHSYLWTSSRESSEVLVDTDAEFDLSPRLPRTPLLTSAYPQLRALIRFETPSRLRVIIGTPESPLVAGVPFSNANNSSLEINLSRPAFAFEVYRKDDGDTGDVRVPLVSSLKSPLIASDNYWEMGLQCPPGSAVYGLGGLELSNTTLLYSSSSRSASIPYVLCLGPDGKAHGLLIRNTGPMEVSFSRKSNIVILRDLSRSGWDVSVLAGPKPSDVVDQLTQVVGRPALPPYWALGFHVCRDFSSEGMNLTDVNATAIMDEFRTFHATAMSLGLPYDSDCVHERLLNHLNFSASAQLIEELAPAFDFLKANGKKFLLSLPPQVAASEGGGDGWVHDVWVRGASGEPYEGSYRGREVLYPDFTSPNASAWVASRLEALLRPASGAPEVLSGFLLQDNWPEDVSPHEPEELPYLPEDANRSLSDNTVYWSARHWNNKRHYEIHNIYGRQQSETLRNATDLKDPVIMSSSCSLGSQACLNQFQVSPNASWDNLKEALVSVLGKGIAGVSLAGGGPMCGSVGAVSEELCLQWYMLGALLPLARVSSGYPLRDPAHASSAFMSSCVLAALKLRYSLLPYYYTLLHQASITGAPLVRPMFYEFPGDTATWGLHEQFMVGPALLAAPVLKEGLQVVSVYLPGDNTSWYLLDSGSAVSDGSGGATTVSLPGGEGQLVLLVRGGHVVPMQEPGNDTQTSRLGQYKLVVSLDCDDASSCYASGRMTLEENVTVTFHADATSVTIGNLGEACSRADIQSLETVTVFMSRKRQTDEISSDTTTQNTQSSFVPSTPSSVLSSTQTQTTNTAPSITPSKTEGNSRTNIKRQGYSDVKLRKAHGVTLLDVTQPLVLDMNSTSLCNGDSSLVINFV